MAKKNNLKNIVICPKYELGEVCYRVVMESIIKCTIISRDIHYTDSEGRSYVSFKYRCDEFPNQCDEMYLFKSVHLAAKSLEDRYYRNNPDG